MILRNLGQILADPLGFAPFLFMVIGGLVIAITVHEFSHALLAYRMGDDTGKHLGRLSLNPLVHLDITGSLMLLFVGIGWGKPVPVNERAFRRNPTRQMALVAFAGPFSNLFLATVLSMPFKIGLVDLPFRITGIFVSTIHQQVIGEVLITLIAINLLLAVFNLLPIAPLDGSKVAQGILPKNMGYRLQKLDPWGPGILLALLAADWFLGFGILSLLIIPPVNVLGIIILGHPVL
jgi:Zn-dependent protease